MSSDGQQRLNSLLANEVDLEFDTSPLTTKQAGDAGKVVNLNKSNGSNMLLMNFRKPPFDDPRAREAIIKAFDPNAFNQTIMEGAAIVPTTFFQEDSPLYNGSKLTTADAAAAQTLLDTLANEGKPVSFEILAYPTSKAQAEAVQAQLSAFNNLTVTVKTLDFVGANAATLKGDYQSVLSAIIFDDPATLYNYFNSNSALNQIGIDDPAMDEATEKGRAVATVEERKPYYSTIQDRFNQLFIAAPYFRNNIAMVAQPSVGGVQWYALGSLLPQYLWKQS